MCFSDAALTGLGMMLVRTDAVSQGKPPCSLDNKLLWVMVGIKQRYCMVMQCRFGCGAACSVAVKLLDLGPQGRSFNP